MPWYHYLLYFTHGSRNRGHAPPTFHKTTNLCSLSHGSIAKIVITGGLFSMPSKMLKSFSVRMVYRVAPITVSMTQGPRFANTLEATAYTVQY